MEELSAIKFVETKSRFYSHLYSIDSYKDLDSVLNQHKHQYKKACHHCYAIRLKKKDGSFLEEYKDDGEVGHPGKVLLELLITHNYTHHILIISRIFGGTKLGVGGVSRAFRTAGTYALEHHEQHH